LCSEDWWKPQGPAPVLPLVRNRVCWFCTDDTRRPVAASNVTGASICAVCLAASVSSVLGMIGGGR
jgi:hypothetical protein